MQYKTYQGKRQTRLYPPSYLTIDSFPWFSTENHIPFTTKRRIVTNPCERDRIIFDRLLRLFILSQ